MTSAVIPDVSLVMCTIGGKMSCLARLIDSLQAQSYPAFELIIVDQSPPGQLDSIVEQAAKHLCIKYVRSERGLSRARNVGLRHCRARIVAFPDDDCWYPAGLIQRVIDIFAGNPGVGIVTGRTTDAAGVASNGRFLSSTQSITRMNVWFAGNSNSIFVRRDVAARLGGFDESLGVGAGTPFGSGEETDFVLRALASGVDARYFVDLVAHHDQVDVVLDEGTFTRAASYSRGFGRVLRLNGYSAAYASFRIIRSGVAAAIALARLKARPFRLKTIWARGMLEGFRAAIPHENPHRSLHVPE